MGRSTTKRLEKKWAVSAGIGTQVTYVGHPLYLLDPVSKRFTPQGEGYMETVKPLAPWHGYWFLVSSTGNDAPGRATLEAGTLPDRSKVLSVVMDANVSPLNATVYTFRRYQPHVSVCNSECSLTWVTYNGRLIFLYAKEKVFLTPAIHLKSSGTAGNGTGLTVPRAGTFVTIPLH